MRNKIIDTWLNISHIQMKIDHELEVALMDKHDLTLKEFYLLYHLFIADDQQLRLQDLPELVDLSQSAVSRLVNRLEEKTCKCLERSTCEGDRRGFFTRLTVKGNRQVKKCIVTYNEVYEAFISKNNVKEELGLLFKEL